MRHWIFTPGGALVYAALALSVGAGLGLCLRQPPRPLYAFFQDYCRANRVTPAKCESLYYARGDTIWLADAPYGSPLGESYEGLLAREHDPLRRGP